eukprot:43226-Eustigmatos_ZCMA.PRE.1
MGMLSLAISVYVANEPTSQIAEHLDSVGVPTEGILQRGRKRGRSLTPAPTRMAVDGDESGGVDMDVEGGDGRGRSAKRSRRDMSVARSKSRAPS